jgi:hypothetical protein
MKLVDSSKAPGGNSSMETIATIAAIAAKLANTERARANASTLITKIYGTPHWRN